MTLQPSSSRPPLPAVTTVTATAPSLPPPHTSLCRRLRLNRNRGQEVVPRPPLPPPPLQPYLRHLSLLRHMWVVDPQAASFCRQAAAVVYIHKCKRNWFRCGCAEWNGVQLPLAHKLSSIQHHRSPLWRASVTACRLLILGPSKALEQHSARSFRVEQGLPQWRVHENLRKNVTCATYRYWLL